MGLAHLHARCLALTFILSVADWSPLLGVRIDFPRVSHWSPVLICVELRAERGVTEWQCREGCPCASFCQGNRPWGCGLVKCRVYFGTVLEVSVCAWLSLLVLDLSWSGTRDKTHAWWLRRKRDRGRNWGSTVPWGCAPENWDTYCWAPPLSLLPFWKAFRMQTIAPLPWAKCPVEFWGCS